MTIRAITPIADILALQRFPSTYMRVGILVRPTGKRLTRMSFVRFCCVSTQPTLSGIVAAQGRDLSDRCVAGPLASQRFPRRGIVTREDVSRHVWGVVVYVSREVFRASSQVRFTSRRSRRSESHVSTCTLHISLHVCQRQMCKTFPQVRFRTSPPKAHLHTCLGPPTLVFQLSLIRGGVRGV